MKHYRVICRDILKFGTAVGCLRMGQESSYMRPHVCRKLFFLLMHTLGCSTTTFPWNELTLEELHELGPDVKRHLQTTPKHWSHKGVRLYVSMDEASGKRVPLAMHSCWSCLFGYATSASDESGIGPLAEAYITEGNPREFDSCARSLFREDAVPPTPLQVLRAIIVDGRRDCGDEQACPWPLGEAPAVFSTRVPALPFFRKTSGKNYLIVVRNLERRCVFARCSVASS